MLWIQAVSTVAWNDSDRAAAGFGDKFREILARLLTSEISIDYWMGVGS